MILVDADDTAGLRAAIGRLMSDPDLRRRIGGNARKWAEERDGRAQWLEILIGALHGDDRSRENEASSMDDFDATWNGKGVASVGTAAQSADGNVAECHCHWQHLDAEPPD